jgi:hypothetical protein
MKKNVIHSIGLHKPLAEEKRAAGSELDYMIADVSSVLPTTLVVVDGFYGMHGYGAPIKGEPVGAGLLIAGTDRVAVDSTACRLIGVDPRQVPHIVLSQKRGLGIVEEEEINILGTPILDAKVHFNSSIITDYSDILPENVIVRHENACYSCISNFGYFLREHRDQLKDLGKVTIIIGKVDPDTIDVDHGKIVYYGNCAGQEMYGGGFVPGCVPRSRRQVFEALGISEKYESYEW